MEGKKIGGGLAISPDKVGVPCTLAVEMTITDLLVGDSATFR